MLDLFSTELKAGDEPMTHAVIEKCTPPMPPPIQEETQRPTCRLSLLTWAWQYPCNRRGAATLDCWHVVLPLTSLGTEVWGPFRKTVEIS